LSSFDVRRHTSTEGYVSGRQWAPLLGPKISPKAFRPEQRPCPWMSAAAEAPFIYAFAALLAIGSIVLLFVPLFLHVQLFSASRFVFAAVIATLLPSSLIAVWLVTDVFSTPADFIPAAFDVGVVADLDCSDPIRDCVRRGRAVRLPGLRGCLPGVRPRRLDPRRVHGQSNGLSRTDGPAWAD